MDSMTNILPTELASKKCLELAAKLNCSAIGEKLKQKGQGKMFGSLVCTDGSVYYAFSGDHRSIDFELFVPPLYDRQKYESLLAEYDIQIKAETRANQKKALSSRCWEELKRLYSFRLWDGTEKTLDEIYPNAPSGTGDCCAPRLLCQAYRDGKSPLSMAEFFYGDGSQKHMEFYSPCKARCMPILKHIIGLDVVYLDQDIVVVNKPSGLLAIEGRGPDKQDCIASRVRRLYQGCINQPCIHRLDQSTSGLMVLGLNKQSHDKLSLDFEQRKVYKCYEALVNKLIIEKEGIVDLPMRLDVDNRPMQVVDHENGKKAMTNWTAIRVEKLNGRTVTRLKLEPQTGRTHQLRVHCSYGLEAPIAGDALYSQDSQDFQRLMLHARTLSFTHPTTGEAMSFDCPPEF